MTVNGDVAGGGTSVLAPYRVLDLTDEGANYAGMLLAQLGAEVIAVEPPSGQGSRHRGPMVPAARAAGLPAGERSLAHWSFNRGKKSVILDLEHVAADRREFIRLASGADFVIESQKPGHWESIGLGYDQLENPGLIYVSISPFGQDGPKRHYAASDLTVLAASNYMALTGDDDRAPLRPSVPQSCQHAAIDAVGAALIALWERHRSGLGQRIDVAAQASMILATQGYVLADALGAPTIKRVTGGSMYPPFNVRAIWRCRDGYVNLMFLFGGVMGPFVSRLMQWMAEEGACDADLAERDWISFGAHVAEGLATLDDYENAKSVIAAFLLTKSKAELFEAALDRRLLIAPICTVGEVVDSQHFAARDSWETVETPAGRLTFPGPVARLTRSPLADLPRAPFLGEHTEEIREEPPRRPVVGPTSASAGSSPALQGLKVLDFMWVVAGPAATRVLADFGATVVRVESERRMDITRFTAPLVRSTPGAESGGMYLNFNAGKLGLALDMANPEARGVVLDLVRWADVVCESFSPGAMERWGLGYEYLRSINPGLIMLSSSLLGQSGPHATLAGFGVMGAALSGFNYMCGWPDRDPVGPFGSYSDYVAPRVTVAMILAALEYRRQTGEGQYIDLSQAEASLPLLSSAILHYGLDGSLLTLVGNRDTGSAPHGVFRSAPRVESTGTIDSDRWVALSCESDEQWASMCEHIGRSDLKLLNTDERLARQDELEAVVGSWTVRHDESELVRQLQTLGIPSHEVQNSPECISDTQLQARGHFVTTDHPSLGPVVVEGSRFDLSRTKAGPFRPAPMLGEHTYEVLSELLGYDDDRIADIAASGALQ
ncbi:MAG: CoA transferase [Acidimicrobiales bacterium]